MRVRMSSGGDGLPVVCGPTTVMTIHISFPDRIGKLPPIHVVNATSSTREWPRGGTKLSLGTLPPTLRMATIFILSCRPCPSCTGNIHFVYVNSISQGVDIAATNADMLLKNAFESLVDLWNEGWPDVSVSVSGQHAQVCTAQASMWTITMPG